MEKHNEDAIIDKVFLEVPNMDKNQAILFDTDNINISCQYDEKYAITTIKANKSGLIALSKICLQLAYSNHDIVHAELDEYNYFEVNSSAISIEKTDNT